MRTCTTRKGVQCYAVHFPDTRSLMHVQIYTQTLVPVRVCPPDLPVHGTMGSMEADAYVKIYSFHVAQFIFPVPVGEETICSFCIEVHRMGECAQSLSPGSLRTPSRPLCAAVLFHVRMDPAAVRRLLNNSCVAVVLRCKAITPRQVGSRKTRRGARGRPQSS